MSQQTEAPLGMILEETKFRISKKFVKPLWRLKNAKKNCRKYFAFLNACYPKTHLIKSLNSLDSSRPYGRLRKSKNGALGNYFCLKMISKLAPQYIFQKNIQILEAWKPIEDMKFRLDFFCTCHSTYELNIM